MPNVAVQRVDEGEPRTLPIFEEIGKRFEEIRRRAAELFELGGRRAGHALDDWLKAEREVLGGWPAAELKDKNGSYELEMTLPGYDAKEVEVTVTPEEIIVHAESKHESKGEEGKVIWSEFGSNNVYRRFELPARIDVDKTQATLDKGLLRITAAKAATSSKQIPVAA